MHLKKKSQEAKAEVAKKSHEEDQVKVIYNVDIYQFSLKSKMCEAKLHYTNNPYGVFL